MSAPGDSSSSHEAGRRKRVLAESRLPLLAVGAVLFACGILAFGAFSTTLAWTNTEQFCISCHEMRTMVYEEFLGTVHDRNPAGIRATCIDCHVPAEFGPKLVKKIRASKDVWHHLLGTLDTREKFRAHRMRMAEAVWTYMRATDSRECRECHTAANMDLEQQDGQAARKHAQMATSGKTCIDCHMGIAHALRDEYVAETD